MKCVEMLVIGLRQTRACSALERSASARALAQAQEQVGQITQQQNRGEIEQDAAVLARASIPA